jgi:hypothetical protein
MSLSYFPRGFGMSGFPGDGLTAMLLSGILSRPDPHYRPCRLRWTCRYRSGWSRWCRHWDWPNSPPDRPSLSPCRSARHFGPARSNMCREIPTIIAISFMVSSRVSEQGQYWRSDLVPGASRPHAASHVYHASSDPTRSRSAEAVGAAQGARRQARTKSANICCG